MIIAVDVGGANLKIADGHGFGLSRSFALWRHPERLAAELIELLAAAPPAERIVATMTGELADCFVTKADGVAAIIDALVMAAGPRPLSIYLTDGRFVPPAAAVAEPLLAAASNWHALATFAGRFSHSSPPLRGGVAISATESRPTMCLLLDIGSTTTDLIPLVDGRPATVGRADPERLASGELVYTGVERSPICAVVSALPWRGANCPVAQELFATTWDAYLLLGDVPEEPRSLHTADGRPATRACAVDRLARMICADRTVFDEAAALAAARTIAEAQLQHIAAAARRVIERMPTAPPVSIVSGQGEFLARLVAQEVLPGATIVSLNERLGPALSRVAPAHALAVLAGEAGLP